MFIYLVTAPSGHQYVGQTVRTITVRWAEHCYYAAHSAHDYALYRAIRKYGPETFKVELLKEVQTKEELDFYEKFYIKTLSTIAPSGYNLTEGGDSHLMSEETKAKISASNKGKTLSEKARQKISETLKRKGIKPPSRSGVVSEKRGIHLSEEQKQKIRQTMKARGIKPLQRMNWSGVKRTGLRGTRA